MDKNSRIYVAGHRGIAGSALVSYLKEKGHTNIITRTHAELDLCDFAATEKFFQEEKPEYIFFAAGIPCKVTNYLKRADIFYQNLQLQNNIIYLSQKYDVRKMIYFASAYMYPKEAENPISENSLLTGPLEYMCEPYALVKIAGTRMCEAFNLQYGTNFISIAPVNLYGSNGDFDLSRASVQNALFRKIYLSKLLSEKKYDEFLTDLKMESLEKAIKYVNEYGVTENTVEIWGTGEARREFLHTYELADACYFIMNTVNFDDLFDENDKQIKNTQINIGTGCSYSIRELAETIKEILGFKGSFVFNTAKPDSKFNRSTDCTKLSALGWKSKIDLKTGISMMYDWYKRNNK